MAAFSRLVIDADLRVRPCDRLVGTWLGDLRESTLSQIWRSDGARQVNKMPVPACKGGYA